MVPFLYREVAFTLDDLQLRADFARSSPGGVDDHGGSDDFAVIECNCAVGDLDGLRTGSDHGSISDGSVQEELCRTELLDHTVIHYKQATGKAFTQIRLELAERSCGEYFSIGPRLGINGS